MRFYTQNHNHVGGIDLHTKTMDLCILDQLGEIGLHTNIPTQPKPFLKAIQPFMDELVIGVECMFSWYWLADLHLVAGVRSFNLIIKLKPHQVLAFFACLKDLTPLSLSATSAGSAGWISCGKVARFDPGAEQAEHKPT